MKRLLIIYVFVGFTSLLFTQEEKKVDSKVISAIIFKNRALVTREASKELHKGISELIFSNLPTDIQDESVRISAKGNGGIKILDVKVERRFTTETQQQNIKPLEQQIDSLNQLKQIAEDKIKIFNSKKEFIESLKAQSSKYINEKLLLNINLTKDCNEMLQFVDKNFNDIYKGIREQNIINAKLDQKINAIKLEIDQSKVFENKNYKEIFVSVETDYDGKVNLYPSYLVQNASWYPIYDARIILQTKGMELNYYGMIQQSTGEDWKDISLALSTAEPMSVKSLPELTTWFIDSGTLHLRPDTKPYERIGSTYQLNYDRDMSISPGKGSITGYVTDKSTGRVLPGAGIFLKGTAIGGITDVNGKFYLPNIQIGSYVLQTSSVGYELKNISLNVNEKQIANLMIQIQPAAIMNESQIVVMGENPEIQQQISSSVTSLTIAGKENIKYSNVYAKEISTTFEIPTKYTIPSDVNPHKATIAIVDMPIDFEHTSIPKIKPSVYLKGKVFNKNEYPLLEGQINIFVDNDFINKTYLNTVVPSDTFNLALGIDERIQIKRTLINKFQESKGLFGGSKKFIYEYEIQINNTRKTEESISIYDQIPVPMNEDIKVELIEPQKELKDLGNDKKLEWNVKLKSGEKKIIPLKFSVEFPKNLNVHGLE